MTLEVIKSGGPLIEQLLHEEESSSLDFKSEQYPFSAASNEEKSELLKDVLAFSNSWRRDDAYILIGVKEVKGGKSEVVGVSEHIDDSRLQQFVNSKTNRPIEFSYSALEIDGRQVACIKIPTQSRPLFLKKDYGKLKKNTVYIRRGSSTDEALPDEIAEMGASSKEERLKKPILCPYIVTGDHDENLDQCVSANTTILNIPDASEFPEYPRKIAGDYSHLLKHSALIDSINRSTKNSDYYSELALYRKAMSGLVGFKLGVQNEGNTVARDVSLVFDLLGSKNEMLVLRERDLPDVPTKESTIFTGALGINSFPPPSDISIENISGGKKVRVQLGKIQAKDISISNERLYIGYLKSIEKGIEVKVYSDDVEEPSNGVLKLSFEVATKDCGVEDFLRSE